MVIVNLVDGADIWMIQRGRSLRFALEAGERLLLLATSSGRNFKGHKAMQLHVLGLVHHTHPTAAWLAGDPVVRDGLTDHADRSMARPCYEPYSSKSMKVQLR